MATLGLDFSGSAGANILIATSIPVLTHLLRGLIANRKACSDLRHGVGQGFRPPARRLLIPLGVFLLVSLGCSATSLVQRAPTPFPTRILQPTFTPAPPTATRLVLLVTPGSDTTSGVIVVPPGVDPASVLPPTATPTQTPIASPTPETPPTETLTPGPTATPSPTLVPTHTPTTTPTFTPTPFVQVRSALANVRTGPGVDYPVVTQLPGETQITVVGRIPEGTWLQICCVNGESVWISASVVEVVNELAQVALVVTGPAPTPTVTPTPTFTPTATPIIYPFEIAEGPIYMPTNNGFLSIWGKIFVGEHEEGLPLEGYYYDASFEGFERPNTLGDVRSKDYYDRLFRQSLPEREKPFNYKYEFKPIPNEAVPGTFIDLRPQAIAAIGNGTWTLILRDGAGRQMAEAVTFATSTGNANREIYIGWIRRR